MAQLRVYWDLLRSGRPGAKCNLWLCMSSHLSKNAGMLANIGSIHPNQVKPNTRLLVAPDKETDTKSDHEK